MPTSANGATFTGLPSELISVKISSQASEQNGQPKLDASHLGIPTGGYRVYVDGLSDTRGGTTGTSTITAEFYGTAPAAGASLSYGGKEYVCTDVSVDYTVGELVRGSCTYTSVEDTPA